MSRIKLLTHSIKPIFDYGLSVTNTSGYCSACGGDEVWQSARIINDDLANSWDIDDVLRQAFDARESMFCPLCGCSFRLRQLAESITYIYGGKSLLELLENKYFLDLRIAEINSCGRLHGILYTHPNLSYSEYVPSDVAIRSENLEMLTYKDNSFDLILTSDTLEHVPDVRIALKEIRRVLKPGGRHIFTIPIIWNRLTLERQNKEPSYHGSGEPDYLVFSEFGYDMINIIKECGFTVKIYKPNVINLRDTAGVIVATRTGDS
ncbi:MAG: class I SAM-dependent methyltransferase [Candidatus Saccharimonadales bacterium]